MSLLSRAHPEQYSKTRGLHNCVSQNETADIRRIVHEHSQIGIKCKQILNQEKSGEEQKPCGELRSYLAKSVPVNPDQPHQQKDIHK